MSIDLARAVLRSRGGVPPVTRLAAGMSSIAWVATIDGHEWVIRTPTTGDARPDPDYGRESRLNAALRSAGVPATATEVVVVDGVACSVAPLVAGRPVAPGEWSDRFVADVANALAATHALSPGSRDLPGAVERFHLARLWPLDGSSLDDHPVATTLPHLLESARQHEVRIRDEAGRQPCVVHSDLHWYHLLRSPDGHLTGLLDFGDAFAGPPAWDFACLRYYHGEEVGRRVAARYPTGAEALRRSGPLGVAFALYKLDKTPDRPDVVERVARLLTHTDEVGRDSDTGVSGGQPSRVITRAAI